MSTTTASAAAEAPPEPGMKLWHYILTMVWQSGRQSDLTTENEGTLWLHDWATTSGVLKYLRSDVVQVPDGYAGGAILFFRLKPEAISEYGTATA